MGKGIKEKKYKDYSFDDSKKKKKSSKCSSSKSSRSSSHKKSSSKKARAFIGKEMDSEAGSKENEEDEASKESDSGVVSLALAITFVSKSILNSEEKDLPNTIDDGDDDYTPTYCFMVKGGKDDQPKATKWVLDSGCTNHMTGDRNLFMDTALSPSHLKLITYTNKGKNKVLGLLKVAISKDRHMDKVMLVESLGYNLMSISMLCDLDMVVDFGRYRWVVIMEADHSKVSSI